MLARNAFPRSLRGKTKTKPFFFPHRGGATCSLEERGKGKPPPCSSLSTSTSLSSLLFPRLFQFPKQVANSIGLETKDGIFGFTPFAEVREEI